MIARPSLLSQMDSLSFQKGDQVLAINGEAATPTQNVAALLRPIPAGTNLQVAPISPDLARSGRSAVGGSTCSRRQYSARGGVVTRTRTPPVLGPGSALQQRMHTPVTLCR